MKRPISYAMFIIMLMLPASAGIVSADYIGPNRTVTVSQHVTVIKEIATNSWKCTVISWPPEFNAIGCSESEFNFYHANPEEYSFDDGVKTSTKTYPPATVSGTFVCATAGDNGWCRGDPGITLSGSEPVSGYTITSIEGTSGELCAGSSCSWTPPQGEGSITFWAHSSFGDTSEQSSASYKVDTEPPALGNFPGPDGLNGWYVSPMSIAPSSNDATSGIASESVCLDGSCANSITLTEGTHTLEMNATDGAGNSTSSELVSVQVDLTPPSFGSLSSPDGTDGWFVSDVSLSPGAVDTTSGVASESICMDGTCGSTVTITEGIHTISRSATDNAGNTATTEPESISCDITPPVSLFTVPPEGTSIVSPGTVSLSGASTDALSGIGYAQISTDGGSSWQDLTLTGDSWTFTWNTTGLPDGTYPIYVRARDNAGNQENSAHIDVIVSNAPPQVDLEKWFMVGRPGNLHVIPNPLVPLAHVRMEVSGGGKHPDRVINLGTHIPHSVTWDGQWGDGADAFWGSYPVTVTACDIYGNCGSDSGTVFVPLILLAVPTETPTVTPTVSPTPTPTLIPTTNPPVKAVSTILPPTPAPTEIVVPQTREEPQPISVPWSFLAISGLLAGFGILAVSDPRPAALKSLSEQLGKIVSKKTTHPNSRRRK
jgi:hypothetical protein